MTKAEAMQRVAEWLDKLLPAEVYLPLMFHIRIEDDPTAGYVRLATPKFPGQSINEMDPYARLPAKGERTTYVQWDPPPDGPLPNEIINPA